jgi:DNA-binding FrmR family transcriptional regulator
MDLQQDVVDDLTLRLHKIGGQLRGIEQMLADQRDCRDVVTQISAANKALEQVGFLVVSAGLRWCVEHPDESAAQGCEVADVERMFLKLA